jgi:ribosomal protein L5
MDIIICTTAENDSDALELLTKLGMPFKKQAGAKQ